MAGWSGVWRRKVKDQSLTGPEKRQESESESRSVVSYAMGPHGLYSPWNSPGQNTGVGSLSLLHGINAGIKPRSSTLQEDSLSAEPQEGEKLTIKAWLVQRRGRRMGPMPRTRTWVYFYFFLFFFSMAPKAQAMRQLPLADSIALGGAQGSAQVHSEARG